MPSVTRLSHMSSRSPASRASSPCVNWCSVLRWRSSTQMWYMTGCDHGKCSLEVNSKERLRQSQYSVMTWSTVIPNAPPLCLHHATNWPGDGRNGRSCRRATRIPALTCSIVVIPFSRKARTHWRRISFSSFWSRLARLAGKVASNWLNTPLMICATCCKQNA